MLLGLYLIGIAICAVRSGMQRRTEALVTMVFFLIIGASEATPYAGLPLFPAAVFYIAVALCLARAAPRQVAKRPLRNAIGGWNPPFAGARAVAVHSHRR